MYMRLYGALSLRILMDGDDFLSFYDCGCFVHPSIKQEDTILQHSLELPKLKRYQCCLQNL